MKRRDFIKSFAAVSAAVPLATTLASAKGSEKVIETFQMVDIEGYAHGGFVGEDSVIPLSRDRGKLVIESTPEGKSSFFEDKYNDTILYKQNPNYLKPILVLAYNHAQISHFFNHTDLFKNFTPSQIIHVEKEERLYGRRRGSRIIGLPDYWLTISSDIMQTIYIRDMVIMPPNQYFKELNS